MSPQNQHHSGIKRAKFNISNSIIRKVSLFGNVVYFIADAALLYIIAKKANYANNGVNFFTCPMFDLHFVSDV